MTTALLSQGRHGTVYLLRSPPELPQGSLTRVAKVVYAGHGGTSPYTIPHDIVKEARLLSQLDHPNVISLLDYSFSPTDRRHTLVLPYLPIALSSIIHLDHTPHSPLVKFITFQLVSALAYIHSRGIAHRDLCPGNILLDGDGTLKVIDFGIAWEGELRSRTVNEDRGTIYNWIGKDDQGAKVPEDDEWKEDPQEMVCAVGTGHYRAAELLFGPLRYDAQAIDMWALGVILAEFFTARKGEIQSSNGSYEDPGSTDESDGDDDLLNAPGPTRTIDRVYCDISLESTSSVAGSTTQAQSQSERRPLFDCTFGDLGLAASIFRLLGTPTVESWPDFHDLPDAGKIHFNEYPPRPLQSVLPYLTEHDALDLTSPNSESESESAYASETITSPSLHGQSSAGHYFVELLESLLVLDPSRRSTAAHLLRHRYFAGEILVPLGYHDARSRNNGSETASQESIPEDQSHSIDETCSVMVERTAGNLEEVHTLRSLLDDVRGSVGKGQRQ